MRFNIEGKGGHDIEGIYRGETRTTRKPSNEGRVLEPNLDLIMHTSFEALKAMNDCKLEEMRRGY